MNFYFSLSRKLAVCALALAMLTSVATADATRPVAVAAAPATVNIDTFSFQPSELTVTRGTTVEWVNRDQTIHNVLTKDRKLSSPGLDTNDRFSFRFDSEGDYSYFCSLHPQMTGVVHVRAP